MTTTTTNLAGFLDLIEEKTAQVTDLVPKLLLAAVLVVALVVMFKSRSWIKTLAFLFGCGAVLWLTGNLDWVIQQTSEELSMPPATARPLSAPPPTHE